MIKKFKFDTQQLTKLYNEVEGIENFITLDEVQELLQNDIKKQFNFDTLIEHSHFNKVFEKLYNGTYKLFNVYVDIYTDIKLVYSKKTGKRKYNEFIPYVFRVNIYDQYHNNVLFNINVDKIRSKRILEVEL